MEKSRVTEKVIVNVLRKNKEGITITDIVKLAKLSRSTVRVALAKLEGSRRVNIRKIGMAKLYYLKA